MSIELKNHPCFNDEARHTFGRIHLPVAPKCNVQCNFCNRKFDCINESRPGVSSSVLKPYQAIAYLEDFLSQNTNISVVGIAGPGDPFANAEETMETLRGVRKMSSDIILCTATNGLELEPYIEELAEMKVSHVTITINAIDPAISSKIYSWIRFGKKRYTGIEAGELLIERQLDAVTKLKKSGVTVKINSIVIPGINDIHIPEIAKKASELGADILNCIPVYKVADTLFEDIDEPDVHLMNKVKAASREFMPLMYHCQRCRADAAGLLSCSNGTEVIDKLRKYSQMPPSVSSKKPYVAVISEEGVLINRHLGEAEEVLIYNPGQDKNELIETRPLPGKGSGDQRWEQLAEILQDCSMVLASGAGDRPEKILKLHGIEILRVEGLINNALNKISNGEDLTDMKMRSGFGCGEACTGTGDGC